MQAFARTASDRLAGASQVRRIDTGRWHGASGEGCGSRARIAGDWPPGCRRSARSRWPTTTTAGFRSTRQRRGRPSAPPCAARSRARRSVSPRARASSAGSPSMWIPGIAFFRDLSSPKPADGQDLGAQGPSARLAEGGRGRWTAADLARRGHEALDGHGCDPPRRSRASPAAVPRARVGRVDASLRTSGRPRDARRAPSGRGLSPTSHRQGFAERNQEESTACGWALLDSNQTRSVRSGSPG
jgi:hypothetical protein